MEDFVGEGQGVELPALPPRPPPNPLKLTHRSRGLRPRLLWVNSKHKGLGVGVRGRIVSGPAAPGPLPLNFYNLPSACKAFFRARAFSATAMGVGPRMRIMGSLPTSPLS